MARGTCGDIARLTIATLDRLSGCSRCPRQTFNYSSFSVCECCVVSVKESDLSSLCQVKGKELQGEKRRSSVQS